MDDTALGKEVAAFFDAFVDAFPSFDGHEIARRFLPPYSAVHADGTINCFTSPEEIGSYFQIIVDDYYDKGCRFCRYKDLEVISLGRQCALATLSWELCREDGSVLSSWRESYNLARGDAGLRIFASIDHVG